MKKNIIIISSVFFIAAIAFAYYLINSNKDAVENIPSLRPRNNDGSLAAEFLNAQRTVDYYRGQIKKHPDDPKNYVELAQVFLQEARVTGKHHEYIPKAQSLINKALSLDPQNFDANITNASILMTLHQFNKAMNISKWAVKKNPFNSTALGILCDAYVQLGKYNEAINTCDKMISIRPDLRSYSRASYLRELKGDIDGAIDAMKLAADAGAFGKEDRAWCLYNLANLFLNSGKTDTAKFIYSGILEERPSYAFAYSGLAKVMIIKKDFTKAIEYLTKASQITSDHSFTEMLADVFQMMNDKNTESKLIKKVLEGFEQHNADGWNVDHEYVVFSLNHNINLKEALTLAKKDFQKRPNNIDAADTYAWALYKNNNFNIALNIITKALSLNSKNNFLDFHAGMIYASTGKEDEALKYLQKSIRENILVNWTCYEEAHKKLLALEKTTSL